MIVRLKNSIARTNSIVNEVSQIYFMTKKL